MAAPAAVEATKETVQEEASEPLKYKTHVLKVSVHCEGCKKKVKKILHNIDGVYTTNIDLKQQKATVTGNVDAEILIKTLIKKTGKLAELWPEKSAKSKNKKEKLPSDPSSETTIAEATGGNEVEKSTVKVEVIVQEIAKNTEAENTVTGATGNSGGGGGQVKVVKFEEAKPEAPVAGNQLPQPVAVVEIKAPSEVDGSSGKKKKKKGQNGNEKNEEHEIEHVVVHAPAHTGSQFPGQGQSQGQVRYVPVTNYSPPRQPMYHQYPPYYYAPPVHAVSYNTAPYPSTSYGASYYAAPPPQSYGYAYAGSSSETAPSPPPQAYRYAYSGSSMEPYPPSDFDSYSPRQSSDSFEFFSDENPNACEIM